VKVPKKEKAGDEVVGELQGTQAEVAFVGDDSG
jgi:hypothetical protein